ncbi:MAG: hypothetical protein EA402_12060 [Planctomycetota bacterium]|nr:MAG: hypothetical protein EA402_12060 [Planctomycetota bacterium]
MRAYLCIFTIIVLGMTCKGIPAEDHPQDRYRTEDGLIIIDPLPVPDAWRNPAWSKVEERGFWGRANYVIRHFEGNISVHTEGEREKSSYPITMFNYFLGEHERVMAQLQKEDNQAETDHAWTKGIDYYWGFTIKGQMRKLFYFGPAMDEAYRQRMIDAGKIWTADDPRPSFELVSSLNSDRPQVRAYALSLLRQFRENIGKLDDDVIPGRVRDRYADQDLGDDYQLWSQWWKQYADQGWQTFEDIERLGNPLPHPLHGVGSGPVGARWDPSVRGMRVDARNTDNLRAMRDIAVYLMAEKTGNEVVRDLYRDKIQRFVVNLYRKHHGEWDSENYLHHTIAPYHNLYDFAQDEEVVALAKAALDYLYTAAAVKYYRGEAVAPTKRVGGGLNNFVWLYFADRPEPVERPYYDLLHSITSAYRPPMAAIELARGQFPRPAEMINSKPTYSFWLPGAGESPETWETVYYGKSFYLGSAVSRSPQGDVRAFEMRLDTPDGWARPFLANSRNNFNGMQRGDQIGQYRNLVIWLRKDDGARFRFQLPGEASLVREADVWFIDHGLTYLAIHPINLDPNAIAPLGKKDSGEVRFDARQTGGNYAGFAFEAADAEDYGDFADFRRRVLSDGGLDASGLDQGRLSLTSAQGHVLGYQHHDDDNRPQISRDGEVYDWDKHMDVYRPMDDNAPLSVGWGSGVMRIVTNNARFEQTVSEDGTVTFSAE